MSKFILISAGGTGGHMTPAAALVQDLKARGFRVELATDPRGMKFVKLFKDIKIHTLKSGTAGAGITGKIKGALNLGIGILKGLLLIKSLKPDLVIGFGGYPSVPAVFAAQRYDIPTILHESNAVIGKANLFLAPEAERIALTYPYYDGLEKTDMLKCVITGNPIRADIAALSKEPYPQRNEKLNILIMGGSLGASILSEVVPKAMALLTERQRSQIHIVQQCREADLDSVRAAYAEAKIEADLATFFEDVAYQLKSAHLFIGRSGASTVAEISAVGLPAIYIPLKVHEDEQQKKNAQGISHKGGAWIIDQDDFTPEKLSARISEFLNNPEILPKAAEHAKAFGKPDAAKKLGNLVAALVEQ